LIKLKLKDVVTFRNTNYQIEKIEFDFNSASLKGVVVDIPSTKKIELNNEIEIVDVITNGLECKYVLNFLQGEICEKQRSLTFVAFKKD